MITSFARYWYHALFLLLFATCCTPAVTGASEKPGNRLFLTSSASNLHPFVGQEIVLTYTLCFKDVAPKISSETNPSFTSLWAKESLPERFIKSMPKTVGGEPFRSAVVKQFRVVPLQSGSYTIAGYGMQCMLPQQEIDKSLKELPETPVNITAPSITLSVLALPEPVPESFSGGIGSFSLDLLTDHQNIRIGEPLSLQLTMRGKGSLHTLQLPGLTLPESFLHNPPERSSSLDAVTSTVTAWPQSKGTFQIPALRTAVFNPETRTFSTLFSNPLTITVDAPLQGEVADEAELPAAGTLRNNLSAPVTAAIILIVIVLLLTVAAVVMKRRKVQRSAGRAAPEGQLEQRVSAGEMKQQLFTLLEAAGMSNPGAMTRRELEGALLRLNVSTENRLELSAVLDSLDKILYTPSVNREMQIPESVVAKVNALLALLKKVEPFR
jgi:hypothetical protein